MLFFDGNRIKEKDLVINDVLCEKLREHVLEQADYVLTDFEIKDIAEDYVEAAEIAPDFMFEVWYTKHHYSDVWSKVTEVLQNLFESAQLWEKKIEDQIETYNEVLDNAYYDVAMLELESKMKFFGVKHLQYCHDFLRERDGELWWEQYDHIDETETRVWLLYFELANNYTDKDVGDLDDRIRKGHRLYRGSYDPVMEYDTEDQEYKSWGSV